MMGQSSDNPNRLFYSFNLEEHVPANHLLRGIAEFFDLSDLRAYLAPFYSHTGRPSIDPELMIRMLVVGYCFGIRLRAAAVRRSAPELGVPLVLSAGD
jgi:transposase